MLDQLNNFYLINLSILITCLLNNVRILCGEVSRRSLLGVKGLRQHGKKDQTPNVPVFVPFFLCCYYAHFSD